MISVAVHRHNPATGRPGAVKSPLTPYGLRWSGSVNPPWGGLVASFDVSFGSLRDMPIAGDWLVAKNGKKHLAWGRVVDPGSAGVALQGKTPAPNIINVVATNWLNLLAKSQVTVTELRRESVGTLLSYGDWFRRKSAISVHSEGLNNRDGHVGRLFAETFVGLAEITLPESLGGGTLADRIEVLYNGRQDPSGTRVLEPVIGWTDRGAQSHAPRDTAVMDILMGTFVPDRRLVEIFPSDEPAANRRTNLGGVLGDVNPALIYRLKPWRAHALGEVVARNLVGRSGGGDALRGAERFATPSWRLANAATVDWSEVESFDVSANDEMRCNAVSVGLPSSPQSPEALSEAAGLPAMDAHDIRGHGLRMETIYWPFFDFETGGSSFDAMRLVAALGAQILFGGHRYRAGKVRLTHLRTDIRHGEPIKIGGDFTAYVETVEHTAVNVGSTPTGQTTLTVSRGLFGWEEDVRRPAIELTQADPSTFARALSGGNMPGTKQSVAAIKTDIIYHRGVEFPISLAAKGLPGVWWMPITGVKDPGHRRKDTAVNRAEIHYTVGSHGQTPVSLQRYFQGFYDAHAADPEKGLKSVHFAIGKAGEIYQYIDTSFIAAHDGNQANNTASIGIDLLNPFGEGKASKRKDSAWPVVTVPWTIQRPAGHMVTVADFFGPTARQLDALAVLLAALTKLPTSFELSGRYGTTVPMPVKPTVRTFPSGTVLAPGVYHHAELNTSRKDSVGVDLESVVAAAAAVAAS